MVIEHAWALREKASRYITDITIVEFRTCGSVPRTSCLHPFALPEHTRAPLWRHLGVAHTCTHTQYWAESLSKSHISKRFKA